MIILGIFLVLTILGIVLVSLDPDDTGMCYTAGLILTILSGTVLLIALISIPICRIDTKAQIKSYHATVETLKVFRGNGNKLEKATLINKVIELNRRLTETKYYNETLFDIWIPDEVNDLELIK